VTSEAALLTVNAVSRISNLSLLTSLGTAGESFTLGYIIGGLSPGSAATAAKPLLIRAAGPSLGALGVPGTLDDPKLELFAGTAKTTENDNWGGGGALANAMSTVGAFPFASVGSRDAAVLADITTRDNSAKISASPAAAGGGGAGAGVGTGTVIAEIYDATPANAFTVSTPRLVNVSVLKPLGSGLTAGFVIAGSAAKTVLIRAIGPGLSAFGVASGFAADPQLVLFNSASARIGESDNWGGTKTLSDASTAVGAFALAADSRDAALLSVLPPGSYSVEVKPVAASATGLVLVEVYEVP
jgi:hypothetical protein